VRIFIDETVSFGTFGKSGKGITEHFGVPVSHSKSFIRPVNYFSDQ